MTNLRPQAVAALTRTWTAILEDRYPELRGIRVSLVGEDERLGGPAVAATRGEDNLLTLPDDVQTAVKRRRAA